MGVFHYYGFREYEAALTEFQRAIELQPNNSAALQFVASVHRRQGKWNATLDEFKRALRARPARCEYREHNLPRRTVFLRNWKEAEEMARHALTIDPHEAIGMRVLLRSSAESDRERAGGFAPGRFVPTQ